MRATVLALALTLVSLVSSGAFTQDGSACTGFAWPLETELAWMSAAEIERIESGAALPAPPAHALTVALKPTGSITLPIAPTGRPKGDMGATFSGLVTVESMPKPGLYQVTLSSGGWIDAVQNGTALKSVSHTGKKDCPTIHKSVRFEVGAGPLVLQPQQYPQEHGNNRATPGGLTATPH